MEREIMLTGIGGQGVQLAGQVLARAATLEGRHVSLFGVYSGVMRGGNTDATVIVADRPIESPPIVSRTWSAVVMHHQFWPELRPRLRPGGLVVVNSTVFEAELGLDPAGHRVVEVAATATAAELGNIMTASMVVTGAYATVTGLVSVDACIAAMRDSIPPYRSQHVPLNEEAIRAGSGLVEAGTAPAWTGTDATREVPA